MAYSVQSQFVRPRHALWESLHEQNAHVSLTSGGCKHQRCVPVSVTANTFVLMADFNEEFLCNIPVLNFLYSVSQSCIGHALIVVLALGFNGTYSNFSEACFCCQMQRCVALVLEVWVAEE